MGFRFLAGAHTTRAFWRKRGAPPREELMDARTRKAVGCFALLAYLAAYALLAASIGGALAPRLPAWGELVYYAAAGIIWIFPLRRCFRG
jgi:hypothetical protein